MVSTHKIRWCLLVFAIFATQGWGQTLDNLGFEITWIGTGSANWTEGDLGGGEGDNWETQNLNNFQPDRNFNEYALISNNGIAVLNSAPAANPTDVILGWNTAGTGNGGLALENGAVLNLQPSDGSYAQDPVVRGHGYLVNGFNNGSGYLAVQPNTNVQALGYYQNGNSELAVQLDGLSFNPIQINGDTALDGLITIETINGYQVSRGQSWTILQTDGTSIQGDFSFVGSAMNYDSPGLGVAVDVSATQVTVSIEQARLIAQVDPWTGSVGFLNPAGHSRSFSIDAYKMLILSGGTFDSSDERWNSFQDHGGTGFHEANPTTIALSELNPTGAMTFAPGDSYDFGTPIDVDTASLPFGVNPGSSTMQISYTLEDGTIHEAAIEVLGNRHNNLVLVVDPDTGDGWIQNQSPQDVEIDTYRILSASGALTPGTWDSLNDQAIGSWHEANPTDQHLAELNPDDTQLLSEGDTFSLGTIWDPNGNEDLFFQFTFADGTPFNGVVVYGELLDFGGILGDVNGDGLVNGFDVDPFVDVLLNGPYQAEADVNEDGAVNGFDVDPFVALVLGGGSAPTGTEVPEPATMALLGLAGLITCKRRK